MPPLQTRRRRPHLASAPVPPEQRTAVDQALVDLTPMRRDKALPLLQAIQSRLGHLPAPALTYASQLSRIPLADLNALISFYDLLLSEPPPSRVVHVCDDMVCRCAGKSESGDLAEHLKADGYTVHHSACLGQCDRAPASVATSPDPAAPLPTPARKGWPADHTPLLLARCGRYAAIDLDGYTHLGGLAALRTARTMSPADLVALVKSTALVGRGGAAFPTGVKWEGVFNAPTPLGAGPDGAFKYVVINGDESEPGTFSNRVLMEEDPLAVVEAALIAAHAVGAQQIYIYIRGEYPHAIAAMRQALTAMRPHMDGVSAEVRSGAGAYVCGEETALFASIEGGRGEPRVKPPFPSTNGLWQRPTLINNVETLHNLLPILTGGAEAWNAVQPKLFCISGAIAAPGVYELRLGTPLSGLIALAGGPTGPLQAVLMGGAAGMFLDPHQLDTPLDFRAMAAAGATLGSGAVMLFDHSADLWETARRLARFFAAESCGKCVPCRLGTARQAELVDRLAAGETQWVPLHAELGLTMADASICGLGQTATNAVRSLLALKGMV